MGGRRSAAALVLMSVIAGGCGAGSARFGGAPTRDVGGPIAAPTVDTSPGERPDVPTLMIENRSGYPVGVYLNGARIGTATAGRSCIRIPQSLGELRLVFATPGGPGYPGPLAFLEESRHWQVELSPAVSIKYDVIGLTPSRASCLD